MEAEQIQIASPNFLADPHRASAIIEVVPEDLEYHFAARVDSLYLTIRKYPDVWKRFSAGRNSIALGIESFLPERLFRMGKYPKLEQAQRQEAKLKAILEFFKGTPTNIVAHLIWLDWNMTLDEDARDREILGRYLSSYPGNFFISSNSFLNYLRFQRGSKLSEEMEPMDFFRFRRDPLLQES